MNQEIIRMAREAEFHPIEGGIVEGNLLRFAALVSAAEREACAKVCDDLDVDYYSDVFATAIRARGQA
jgi:hypothetical protein